MHSFVAHCHFWAIQFLFRFIFLYSWHHCVIIITGHIPKISLVQSSRYCKWLYFLHYNSRNWYIISPLYSTVARKEMIVRSRNVQVGLVMNVLGKTAEGQKNWKKFSETWGMFAQQSKLLYLVSDCKGVRKLWFSISVGTVHTDWNADLDN